MSASDRSSSSTVFVCETCAWPDGEKIKDGRTGGDVFADHVAAAAEGRAVSVRRHACLMNCGQSCSAAVTAPGKITYVLGRFDPDADAADALVAYAAGHAESESGAVPYRTWPEGVKGKFIARVPPIEEA